MNKYKLINKTTGEEHLCNKIVVDGWDYYVSENYKDGDYVILPISLSLAKCVNGTTFIEGTQKVIATNNPIIDIPKVVDETWIFFKEVDGTCEKDQYEHWLYKSGYNKSQETHPNSDSDTAEFAEWLTLNTNSTSIHGEYIYKNVRRVTKELIQIWKEQKPKTLYYE